MSPIYYYTVDILAWLWYDHPQNHSLPERNLTALTHARTGFNLTTLDLVTISLFSVLITLCAWISIPSTVPFTLQTFGILCALGLLGGKRATLAVLVYLLMGAIGIPVFAGFRGGLGVLAGVTGGYLIGFLCSALLYWLITSLGGDRFGVRILGMIAGLIACYAFGTAWFIVAYARTTGPVGLGTALGWCVVPFVLPEIIKTALAILVVRIVPQRLKALQK